MYSRHFSKCTRPEKGSVEVGTKLLAAVTAAPAENSGLKAEVPKADVPADAPVEAPKADAPAEAPVSKKKKLGS